MLLRHWESVQQVPSLTVVCVLWFPAIRGPKVWSLGERKRDDYFRVFIHNLVGRILEYELEIILSKIH